MTTDVERYAQEPMLYFPHDSTAASDIKCQRLIFRLGYEGYGRWWRLCEHMAATKTHRVPFETDEDVLILAQVLGFGGGSFDSLTAIEDCRGFVLTLLEIGLLTTDKNGLLKNSRMDNNALYFGKQKANGHKGGRPRKNAVTSKTTGRDT